MGFILIVPGLCKEKLSDPSRINFSLAETMIKAWLWRNAAFQMVLKRRPLVF